MKRLLALLLSLVMLLTLIPAAAAEDIEIVEVEPEDEPITVVDPEAPAELAGENEGSGEVDYRSGDCGDHLTYVLDEDGTLTISGTGAMWDYEWITSPVTPKGWSSAPWCRYFSRDTVKKVVFEEGVTYVGEEAFDGCTSLSEVVFSSTVSKLGSWSFQDTGVTSFTVPATVTEIAPEALLRCLQLTEILVEEGNPSYCSVDGVLFSKDMTELLAYPIAREGSYTVPDGVLRIGQGAFDSAETLSEVILPEGLTEIGGRAFFKCYWMQINEFPQSLTVIGSRAFQHCFYMGYTDITLPDSLRTIGVYAFADIPGLQQENNYVIEIPAGLTEIGRGAFGGCGLTGFRVDSGNPAYCAVDGVLMTKDLHELVQYPMARPGSSYTVPTTVTRIGGGAFYAGDHNYGCGYFVELKNIILPEGLTEIGAYAFEECYTLEAITLPETLVTLEEGAFQYAQSLTSIIIPDSVTSIGDKSFYCCRCLESAVIGRGVTSIGKESFYYCTSLSEVVFRGSAPEIGTGIFYGISTTAYYPGGDPSWTEDVRDSYNGYEITWKLIDEPPVIIAQPQSETADAGATVKFKVKASAAETFQWQYRTGSSGTWKNSTTNSAKTPSLSVEAKSFRNGYQYRCKVSNAAGYIYTDIATLTVTAAEKPSITTQPADLTIVSGGDASFTVEAENVDSYQWYWRENSSASWQKCTVSTAKTKTLVYKNLSESKSGRQYRCKLTNSVGSVYTNTVTLTVVTKPTITTQPKSQSAAEGTTVKFTVAATGGSLKYQWYYRTSSSGSWQKSSGTGATTKTLTVESKAYRDGYQYRCRVSNAAGYKYSSAATLTVVVKPTITTQPASKTVSAGTTVKFTVKATGGDLSYQWYYRTSSTGSWQKCTGTGATTATLSVEAKSYRSGYQYRCKVSNAAGYKYSSAATLTVK